MNDIIDNIQELRLKQHELYKELDMSLAIQSLWKEAFVCGSITSNWSGNSYRPMNYTIKRSDTETRTYKENELPMEIYNTMPAGRRSYLESIHRWRKI